MGWCFDEVAYTAWRIIRLDMRVEFGGQRALDHPRAEPRARGLRDGVFARLLPRETEGSVRSGSAGQLHLDMAAPGAERPIFHGVRRHFMQRHGQRESRLGTDTQGWAMRRDLTCACMREWRKRAIDDIGHVSRLPIVPHEEVVRLTDRLESRGEGFKLGPPGIGIGAERLASHGLHGRERVLHAMLQFPHQQFLESLCALRGPATLGQFIHEGIDRRAHAAELAGAGLQARPGFLLPGPPDLDRRDEMTHGPRDEKAVCEPGTGGAAGAVGGALVGGPVGAAIGGAAGAAAGAVGGAVTGSITADDQIYVRERVIRHNVPSVRYQGDIVVGAELPGTVRYYEIENEPRFTNYRYTRLNDRYVLVNTDNRIVAVFD